MPYTKTAGTFVSKNGSTEITYYLYEPISAPRAILQLSHGMAEYIERYEPFIRFLAEHGILVAGNDHLGHGNSVKSKEDYGYFAEKDGYRYLYQDLHQLTEIVTARYPSLPTLLLGHSMGSFVARAYLAEYGDELDAAILVGTSGKNPLVNGGLLLSSLAMKRSGAKTPSPFLDKMAFGSYNKRFQPQRTSFDWLSGDPLEVDRYLEDPKCGFLFTAGGFHDLFSLLKLVSSDACMDRYPKELPLYFLSGALDPVGNYGKGVQETCYRLKKKGIKTVLLKLYPEGRHEIINELNKSEVYEDILKIVNTYALPNAR